MRTIFAEYNPRRNSIDVYTSVGYMLRIDCWEAEKNLKTTPGSDCALNALAIDEPLEYARLYLSGNMQMWVDAEDSSVIPSSPIAPLLKKKSLCAGANNSILFPSVFTVPSFSHLKSIKASPLAECCLFHHGIIKNHCKVRTLSYFYKVYPFAMC